MFSDLLQQLLLALLPNEPVYYIGGSEVLPPPLSREEETAALTALCAGDKSAERTLIEHNLRLVVYIARRFENTGVGLEDLISIGTIGLIKAVSTFDREKNIKLATYASRCIENEILMYLRKLAAQRTEVSFDEPLNTDWDGNELLLSDVLGTDEDEVSRPMEDDADRRALHEAVAKLSERDRDIISLRFGLLGRREYTQKEVADRMGISQSYISRLEKRILLRLRREMQKIMARSFQQKNRPGQRRRICSLAFSRTNAVYFTDRNHRIPERIFLICSATLKKKTSPSIWSWRRNFTIPPP